MVAHLAGFVWWLSQSLLSSNFLDWMVFPRWRCLRWRPVRREELVSISMFAEIDEISQGSIHANSLEKGSGASKFSWQPLSSPPFLF
jgi:hypothetical protein